MKSNFTELLPNNFSNDSRVWIYQCNRPLSLQEALGAEEMLQAFVSNWNSHGTPVKGYANLFFGQFVVLIADETAHGVSGCSTDSSIRLIKDLEKMFGVNMFDRLLLAFLVKEKVQTIPLVQLDYALKNGFIDGDTRYFNNTVQTLAQLKESWLLPLKDSWLGKDRRYSALLGAYSGEPHS